VRDLPTPLRTALVLVLLYVFLVGVSLLEDGIAGLGDGFQSGLLENVANPVSGLFAGILFTVLVQSSSVSTATIVGLVGSGTLSVELAVPMIMGANIGTTITNTLASLGSIRRSEEFRRGFAAATVHDFFNLLAVAILLPIELLTGVLSESAQWLTERLRGSEVSEIGKSPVKRAVDVPVDAIEAFLDASPGRGALPRVHAARGRARPHLPRAVADHAQHAQAGRRQRRARHEPRRRRGRRRRRHPRRHRGDRGRAVLVDHDLDPGPARRRRRAHACPTPTRSPSARTSAPRSPR
jgi:hypothetical protein